MSLSEKDVTYVADLAHLDLTADERARMVRDLNSILDYINTLAELDTDNVDPMAQVMASADGESTSRFAYAQRDDVLLPCLTHDVALQNAPESSAGFFKVPRVIER
jgi:aspartyl-tRNA(Asn)/glutamyl-tRNA(Gln) amidotransferase subunit C